MSTTRSDDHNALRERQVTIGIIVTFVLLAVVFLLSSGSPDLDLPEARSAVIPDGALSTEPRRKMLSDPPRIFLNSFERDCMDCHFMFKTSGRPIDQLMQHREIGLSHGINGTCEGCHNAEDRNVLSAWNSDTIPFAESHRLCAQCHGPTFRDWEEGIHGRATGSWKTDSPKRGRLSCVECHDPHHPAYEAYRPLPGPNTLHMGEQSDHGPEGKGPLRQRMEAF